MSEYNKDIEKMISHVMRTRELSRAAAIGHMLAVATGRMNALRRYDKTVPEGKETKGIFQIVRPKKLAPKSAKISDPLKRKPKPKRKGQIVESESAA